MIVVKLELWPGGDESRAQDLGKAIIGNESNLADISDYSVYLLTGAKYSRNPGTIWRTGEVKGFPRTSYQVGPWELLFLALESALGSRVALVKRLCGMSEGNGIVVGKGKG